ncbi:MAG: hypothetical protein GY928_28135 [Colwellia sp.]|nr:hypothetical protein [Colwellia sp.]
MSLVIEKAWDFKDVQTYTTKGRVYNINACLTCAEGLEVRDVIIEDLYMGYDAPCADNFRSFISHMKMVEEADLSYPVLMNEDGVMLDGRHRLAKAILEGHETIKAVRFEKDPSSCWTWEE